MTTRERIQAAIRAEPGIHFNELGRRLTLANGQIQYHVRRLERADEVDQEIYAGRTHYYDRDFDPELRRDVAVLRRETARDILSYLRDNGSSPPAEIAQRLGIARSTVEYHLDRLCDCELITKCYGTGSAVTVKISNHETVRELLGVVEPTFPERMTDRFTRLFDDVLHGWSADMDNK
jgi:predicted transcriptional regulator